MVCKIALTVERRYCEPRAVRNQKCLRKFIEDDQKEKKNSKWCVYTETSQFLALTVEKHVCVLRAAKNQNGPKKLDRGRSKIEEVGYHEIAGLRLPLLVAYCLRGL